MGLDGTVKLVREDVALELVMASDMRLVNQVVAKVRAYFDRQGVADCSPMILTARELINNAIVHGNKAAAELVVRVQVDRPEGNRFRLTVEDQGDGFDHEACDLVLPENPGRMARRGLALVNAYCDCLDFKRGGVQVVAVMRMPVRSGFEEDQDESWKVVRPIGDITAGNAAAFRELLFKLKDNGYQKYRFDMVNVEVIDSIALSMFVVFANSLRADYPNTRLEMINVRKDVHRLFEVTRLDRQYRVSTGGKHV